MVLQLAQRLSKGVVHPQKKLHEASHTRYYGKCQSNRFFTGKVAFFSENCVFNIFLGVTEMILALPQKLSKHFMDPHNFIPEV